MRVGTDGVLLGAWSFSAFANSEIPLRCMDVGCGTGLLALMLAQRFPKLACTGIEIEPEAAKEAQENFRQSAWADRLKCHVGNFLDLDSTVFPSQTFDLIISNPPFFNNGVVADGSRGVARHSESLPPEQLLTESYRLLKPQGHVAIIVPYEQADHLMAIARDLSLTPIYRTNIRHNPSRPIIRSMLEFVKDSANNAMDEDILYLHDAANRPTPEYRKLVEQFYLRIH